jgi:hypothetical protein
MKVFTHTNYCGENLVPGIALTNRSSERVLHRKTDQLREKHMFLSILVKLGRSDKTPLITAN